MKELQEMFNSEVSNYLDSGALQKKVQQKVAETFDSCIDDAFRWGPINKNLKAIIEEKMVISLDNIDLQSYNAVMLEALKGQIAKYTNDRALERFEKEIEEIFKPAPKEISINDIVEKVVESWRSDDPCECDAYDTYASIEHEVKTYGTAITIKKDESYSPEVVHLWFNDSRLRISHKMDLNPTTMYGIEGWIFNLYAGGTTITGIDSFDPDDCNLALWEDRS